MIVVLLDGRALTARELALRADVTPPTASFHLAKLASAGSVRVDSTGRHRYDSIAGPAITAGIGARSASSRHSIERSSAAGSGPVRRLASGMAGTRRRRRTRAHHGVARPKVTSNLGDLEVAGRHVGLRRKGCGFYPSCDGQWMSELAAQLVDLVLGATRQVIAPT
jgi:DNA-binding transcriptional ArsR family regulator